MNSARSVREPARDLPVVAEADVAVVGGGPAGIAAAVAAARCGAEVVLIERYGCLGGLATGGLVLYMACLFDGEGRRAIGGLCWELMERLRAAGGLAEERPRRLHADSELLKAEADRVVLGSGVRLRLHSWASGAVVEDGAVRGVITESKSGRQAVLARVTVDATGDGDVAAWSGAQYESSRQCIGLNYKLANVDRAAFEEMQRSRPEELARIDAALRQAGGYPIRLGATPDSGRGVFWVNVLGLATRGEAEAMITAGAGEEHDEGRRAVRHFDGSLDATSVEDLTYAEVELRGRVLLSLDTYRKTVPGFQQACLAAFASQLGVRDSRRVGGLHRFTREEVLAGGPAAEAIGAVALDLAPRTAFAVPYGCLVPSHTRALLVAGRCLSCDRWTHQTMRLIPPAFVTGQAAGAAAALAARGGVDPGELEYPRLRAELDRQGVVFAERLSGAGARAAGRE